MGLSEPFGGIDDNVLCACALQSLLQMALLATGGAMTILGLGIARTWSGLCWNPVERKLLGCEGKGFCTSSETLSPLLQFVFGQSSEKEV